MTVGVHGHHVPDDVRTSSCRLQQFAQELVQVSAGCEVFFKLFPLALEFSQFGGNRAFAHAVCADLRLAQVGVKHFMDSENTTKWQNRLC